jgi:hydroxymethylpyrimidine pyrophosphatase-like HAD family hydrolase
MMPRALACDYDGTLATEDRLVPATLAALERARTAGLRLVLLTGRTFFELPGSASGSSSSTP